MVSPAKIFHLAEPTDLGSIAQKLKDFREEMPYETENQEGTLVTNITDIEAEEDKLIGIFAEDSLMTVYQRDGEVEIPTSRETPLVFKERRDGEIFLIILEEKPKANRIANKLSEALFLKKGGIVEPRIPEETLKEIHESNPRATKVIYFDNVDIPDVGKLALYGSSVADTSLYQEYLDHGKVWYAVFRVEKRDIVVGITRNCVIVLFSKLERDEFVDYILEDLLPLVSVEE